MAHQKVEKAICGRCGSTYLPPRNHPHTSLCPRCPVPHQLVSRIQDGVDRWRCAYCGDEGSMIELENGGCTHVYPPCPSCGEHPFCAPDCAGVAAALSGCTIGF